jgi:hypothetical protein
MPNEAVERKYQDLKREFAAESQRLQDLYAEHGRLDGSSQTTRA